MTTYYQLDFPNQEVQSAFSYNLLASLSSKISLGNYKLEVLNAFLKKDYQKLITTINAIISSISYNLLKEAHNGAHYSMLIYLILSMSIPNVKNEEEVSTGRSDLVIEYNNQVLIIEIKLDQNANKALEQIKEKAYYKKYKGKNITLLGINIDSKKREITDWKTVNLLKLTSF